VAETEGNLQHYIPVSRASVKQRLFEELVEDEALAAELAKVSGLLEAIWHHRAHSMQEHLKRLYEQMDPDGASQPQMDGFEDFLEVFESALEQGNWEPVSDEEMQAALEGEDVFPISLHVRFDEFEQMRLYRLGEMLLLDERSSLFGMRKRQVEVQVYDRVIQLLQFREKEWFEAQRRLKHHPGDNTNGLHLRLFKTVPKLDLETIFPNTSPNMRTLDKVKIIVPLVGGLVTLGLKFGPVIAFALLGVGGGAQGSLSLSLLGGLLSALGTYILKTYMSYQKTREKYLSRVSKDLYFKGQANNSAVLNMVIDLSEEQEVKEALLAYTFLLTRRQQWTQASLDEAIEAWLSTTFGIEVDFEVDDALSKLDALGLLRREGGSLSVVDAAEALALLDAHWDGLYDY